MITNPHAGTDNEYLEACDCCGAGWPERGVFSFGELRRCGKHLDRDPCLIEGCTRTAARAPGSGYSNDRWLCAQHWRAYVPPHSRTRRAYHALYRKGKRLDWPMELRRRWWKLWAAIVRQARRRHGEGFVDERAVNKLFGWDDAA